MFAILAIEILSNLLDWSCRTVALTRVDRSLAARRRFVGRSFAKATISAKIDPLLFDLRISEARPAASAVGELEFGFVRLCSRPPFILLVDPLPGGAFVRAARSS